MHVNNIIVHNKDIRLAEETLLKEGQTFDEARRNYIKDFNTLDLIAVPGSGKTTLLLSKLLILEKHLPFMDNTGILVISHTNTAVNEIQNKLKLSCPNLFRYPNFVGTIQGFVNKYLALPFYEKTYNQKIKSMNEELYHQQIEGYFHSMKNYKLKMWLTNKHEPIELLKRIRFDINENLIIDINGDKEKFILKDKSLPVYKGLKQMKQMLLNLGVLHYDDAYYLAMKYININPNVVKLLQKRFSYVFVDEMQDMDFHQYQLLEKVFSDANMEGTSFQRLGDNNQAIYNNKVNSYAIWESRDKVYTINGSNRLTRLNAKLASRFSIDNSFIEGININDKEYKPVLLVYDEKKVECSVIKSFSEYLNELFEEEKKFDDIIYKVVSWRRNHKDKISLSSYCPKNIYMRGNHSSKESLINKNFDYYKVTQILIEKIVGILNKADIKLDNQDITKFSLINYLNDMQNGEYEKYKLSIYRCVNFLFNKEYQTFYQEFKKYLEQIVALLDATNSQDYLLTIEELEFEFIGKSEDDIKKCEECDVKGNSPIVDSVHSVKGETHDVTLFLESFYNSNYESDILHEVLCGKTIFELIQEDLDKIKEFEKEIVDIKSTGKDRGIKTREDKIHTLNSKIRLKKQYAKMVYVALTRSKSVVGYGINANKYNVLLKDHINTEEWNIIFVE